MKIELIIFLLLMNFGTVIAQEFPQDFLGRYVMASVVESNRGIIPAENAAPDVKIRYVSIKPLAKKGDNFSGVILVYELVRPGVEKLKLSKVEQLPLSILKIADLDKIIFPVVILFKHDSRRDSELYEDRLKESMNSHILLDGMKFAPPVVLNEEVLYD